MKINILDKIERFENEHNISLSRSSTRELMGHTQKYISFLEVWKKRGLLQDIIDDISADMAGEDIDISAELPGAVAQDIFDRSENGRSAFSDMFDVFEDETDDRKAEQLTSAWLETITDLFIS